MSGPLCSALGAAPLTRRSLLAASVVGTAALLAACTGEPADTADAVTPAQVDQLAAQVRVQEQLVAAYDQALAADPTLAATAAVLAEQARAQLERLRAAAPGSPSTGTAGTASAPPPGGTLTWLGAQVGAAADAHTAACPTFTGGRAALLGSIAAGLRGQQTRLA